MDGGEESIYSRLLDRFQDLEASHHKLKEQFQVLLQEKNNMNRHVSFQEDGMTPGPGWGRRFSFESPYRSVLENIGHAVHVSRAASGEIIYWNNAAEKLYGYKDYEVVGQRAIELLLDEEHHRSAQLITETLITGQSWSGQLPLRKSSGQNFMAMVSKSPLYENGELVGIITVSSDASVYNNTNSENSRTSQHHADDEQPKFRRINLKKIQWHVQPQAAAVPQIPSSISNLASKFLSRKRGDDTCDVPTRESDEAVVESQDAKADRPPRVPIAKLAFGLSIGRNRTEGMSSEKEESTSEFFQPPKIAVKLFSKLQRGAFSNSEKAMDENIQENDSEDNQTKTTTEKEKNQTEDNIKSGGSEDASPRQLDSPKIPSSGETVGSGPHSSSSKGENDLAVDSEINWEDVQLKEEIGHGSFAVVYRGVWNGSDVAVKVYTGSQYSDETLLDYKKEIDIMRRLRHPNVLLFMGAVCNEEKLAMVTEYLTRGSLFKTLHRNNQSLDIKRRLRMAIDVARGMNYLHHRNPPIVHRDLKSSNLLVDKSWTVKVGDFGLSKLKYATFVTAKSGRGTPQWMAPEVLRNEPSTEKSDVFSFGVILWELMTERVPWSDLNSLQVVAVVGFMDNRLDIPSNINPQVSSIISDCWRSNPNDRPSFEDIIHKMIEVHANARVIAKTVSAP